MNEYEGGEKSGNGSFLDSMPEKEPEGKCEDSSIQPSGGSVGTWD